MSRSWFQRILAGLLCAVLAAVLSVAIGFAQSSSPQGSQGPSGLDCGACHGEFTDAFESGAHAQPGVNPAFAELGCEACHGPVSLEHYSEPMPVTRTSEQCGGCHIETYFGWRESMHGEVGLDCVSCHDPHATALKAEDSSGLCAACHGSRASGYAHSAHHEEGLLCADCHLTANEGEAAAGPDKRNHSFAVDMGTCAGCHVEQLHSPIAGEVPEPSPQPPDAMGSVETDTVSEEPGSVRPSTFALISGLIGMATGMILAPWLERWYRSIRTENGQG